jgi:tRNA(His) guanylyltransferase
VKTQYELDVANPSLSTTPDSTRNNLVDADAEPVVLSKTQAEKDRKKRAKALVTVQHVDMIKDEFWERRPWLLNNRPGRLGKEI